MRKLLSLIGILTISVLICVVSCKKDDDEPVEDPKATVKGRVMSSNGITPISQAKVFVDDQGDIYLTLTDVDGKFSLRVSPGQHTLHIQSGNGEIFRSMIEIDVSANITYAIPIDSTVLIQAANLAYVEGAYDQIQDIIIDSLGYTATQLQLSDFDNLTTLQNYEGIFLNCGHAGNLDSLKYENLRQFVIGGGSLYTSDWAVEYLTGDGYMKKSGISRESALETHKFSCVGDIGGFIPDSLLCTEKIGPNTTVLNANITATDIQAYLGTTTIDIEYDLVAWEVVQHHQSPWEVMIEDPLSYGPLALRMVMPSTKSISPKQNWVTICHIPPGNPANPISLTIPVSALPAHLAHDDYQGSCLGNGGTIYFTTFHNHPQGSVSKDVQKMLEYFILNL